MNLTKLFEAQDKLDEHILQEHPVNNFKDRLPKKILALQVELGELANELPEVFKFWSNKKNNREKALKEYVDVLHFALSIGNDLKITKNTSLTKCFTQFYSTDSWDAINYFNYTFRQISRFAETIDQCKPDKFLYSRALLTILQLGHKLGFTWDEVEDAYFEKNKTNHERQRTGY